MAHRRAGGWHAAAGAAGGADASWAGPETWAEEESETDNVAQEVLQLSHAAQSKRAQLPEDGQVIWSTLNLCIENVLYEGSGHFEVALREELNDAFHDAVVEIKRESGAQWLVTVTRRGRRSQYYASVRSEMLGDSSKGRAIMNQLKDSARKVKSGLLHNKAEWLRSLLDGTTTEEDFFEELARQEEEGYGHAAPHPQLQDADGPRCHACGLSRRSNLLGGKHYCRIWATFRCCGRWTSQRARYDADEERIMEQRCQRCQRSGTVEAWDFATFASGDADERRAHMSDLCEACDRYGNCTGAFYDPFMMTLAVKSFLGESCVHWEQDELQELWTTEVEGCVLVLQPHVHQSRA